MSKILRSRILEHFETGLIKELYNVCKSSVESDNNVKATVMINILKKYNKDFIELGPGTNRLAILMDNYVFKLALDKWGLQDNLNEFTMSHELQPYVIKTYETNKLISISEYVTVISAEEFEERKEEIRKILGILAEGYLLGDVGTVKKNFCNWGYRDNGELVALDYAYIYRVRGDEILCSNCNSMLEYDENFYNLKCPKCNRKYSFMDIRRKIPMEVEDRENFMALELAYKMTKPTQIIDEKDSTIGEDKSSPSHKILTYKKEASAMSKKDKLQEKDYFGEPDVEEVVDESSYYDALNYLSSTPEHVEVQEVNAHQQELVEAGEEILKETGAGSVEIKETVTTVVVKGNGDTQEDTEACINEQKQNDIIVISTEECDEVKQNNFDDLVDNIPDDGSIFKTEVGENITDCNQLQPIVLDEEQNIPSTLVSVESDNNSGVVNSSLKVFVTGNPQECNSTEVVEIKGDADALYGVSIDDLRKELGADADMLGDNYVDPYEKEYEEIDNFKMNRKRGNRNGLCD